MESPLGWSANSSNRRVLVTDSEGRQTVEEIKNDLGLAANDKKGIDRQSCTYPILCVV
jgi:hypothetical protein